jgi:hypothetical protein
MSLKWLVMRLESRNKRKLIGRLKFNSGKLPAVILIKAERAKQSLYLRISASYYGIMLCFFCLCSNKTIIKLGDNLNFRMRNWESYDEYII